MDERDLLREERRLAPRLDDHDKRLSSVERKLGL
jgi:hypothetical protein